MFPSISPVYCELVMKLVRQLSRAIEYVTGIMAYMGGIVIAFMVGMVCWDILSRKIVFGHGVPWTLEVVEYGLLWFTLLCAAWVLKNDRHVRIDILLAHFSSRKQSILNMVTSIVCALACLAVTWYGAAVVHRFFASGELMPTILMVPKYVPYLIIPVGFALLFLQFLLKAGQYGAQWRKGADGVDVFASDEGR
jgi:C4-dicarboxylate transporter, DctQ subunit